LRKKSDEDFKKQKEKFKDDKVAKLYLKVECQGIDTKHKKEFLDGEEFEIKFSCFCNRDLTEEEVKKLINKDELFSHSKCPLPTNVKTYPEFTKRLNNVFKKYDIDTCLKRAHFIAQIEAESDHFKTTVEYASGSPYEGRKDLGNTKTGDGKKFKGRGLIQLTGRTNYTKYFKYINKSTFISEPKKIAENIEYTFDSAGWYWVNGSAWGDMNPKANEDDLIAVSIGINGGLNGYEHRKKNLKSIIKEMKIKDTCINLKKDKIGVYKYDTSKIKNSKYGKKTKNKTAIEKFDD